MPTKGLLLNISITLYGDGSIDPKLIVEAFDMVQLTKETRIFPNPTMTEMK